jgi:hypothetical protein
MDTDLIILYVILGALVAAVFIGIPIWVIQKLLLFRSHKRTENNRSVEAVWYSWNSEWGAWKHVVLYAHQHKFELRLEEGSGKPIYNCKPCELPAGATRRAVGPLATLSSLFRNEEHSYRLIGWTSLDLYTIDEICRDGIANFGRYVLPFNNCQHFAKEVAGRIIPKNQRAWDWNAMSSCLGRVRIGKKGQIPESTLLV